MSNGSFYPESRTALPAAKASGIRHIVRSLRSRNYRLFFVGQGLSLIGTWMQQTALLWMVSDLAAPAGYKPAMLLGLVGFSSQILTFLVAPFAGVLADRWNRKRTLVATQILLLAQASLLAAVAMLDHLHVVGLTAMLSPNAKIWSVIVLSAFSGLIMGFDVPVRQSFVVEMVERRDDLPNAIALNSILFNSARLVGPTLAGLIIFLTSAGVCFTINAVSYLAVIVALLAMRIAPEPAVARHAKVLHSLKEGFLYAAGFPPIRALLLLLGMVSLVGMPYTVLLPVFANKFQGGSMTYGLMVSAAGAGALAGALFLAARKSVLGMGRWIAVAPTILGLGLIAFSLSHRLWLSLPLLVVVGFGIMVQMGFSNSLLQTIVDDDKRGRVMSFHTMAFMGAAPLGSLLAGGLSSALGPGGALILFGAVCIVASTIFATHLPALRAHIRPIYIRMGILGGASASTTSTRDLADGEEPTL